MTLLKTLLLGLVLALGVSPALAVQPDEMLADPALEQRARDISAGLRCLVCQNESIDESNASLARDLRLLVRERIMAGDDNEQVVDYVVARYGEFVLLQPNTGGWNWLLWATGPLGLLFALIVATFYLRGRSAAQTNAVSGLSDDEQARLDEILKN